VIFISKGIVGFLIDLIFFGPWGGGWFLFGGGGVGGAELAGA